MGDRAFVSGSDTCIDDQLDAAAAGVAAVLGLRHACVALYGLSLWPSAAAASFLVDSDQQVTNHHVVWGHLTARELHARGSCMGYAAMDTTTTTTPSTIITAVQPTCPEPTIGTVCRGQTAVFP